MSTLSDIGGALERVAPTIAGLLGGPLAAMGVTEAEKVFGLTPPAGASLSERAAQLAGAWAQATPDQVIAMKKADNDLETTLVNGGIQIEQISAADRASARAMQIATRSWITPILAALVVVSAVLGEGYAMTHAIPPGSEVIVGRVLGTLDSALMLVLAFYFGSNSSSQEKNALISKALDATPPKHES